MVIAWFGNEQELLLDMARSLSLEKHYTPIACPGKGIAVKLKTDCTFFIAATILRAEK